MTSPAADIQAYCETLSPAEALGASICLAGNLRALADQAPPPPVLRVITIWSTSLIHDLLQECVAKGHPIVPDHSHCSAALKYFSDELRRTIAAAAGGDS